LCISTLVLRLEWKKWSWRCLAVLEVNYFTDFGSRRRCFRDVTGLYKPTVEWLCIRPISYYVSNIVFLLTVGLYSCVLVRIMLFGQFSTLFNFTCSAKLWRCPKGGYFTFTQLYRPAFHIFTFSHFTFYLTLLLRQTMCFCCGRILHIYF